MSDPQPLPFSATDAGSAFGRASRPAADCREIALPLDPRTPARSRAFAQRVLATSERPISRDVVDNVLIVVAELVTASYLRRASRVRVAIELRERDLTVTIRDDRPDDRHDERRRDRPGDRPGDRPVPASMHDTREMLLDALTVERRVFTEGGETVHVARLLVSAG